MRLTASRILAFTLALGAASGSGLLLRAQDPPAVGAWGAGASNTEERTEAAAVALADGRTLIIGGRTADGPTASIVAYDPVTGSRSSAGQLPAARAGHSATLLEDGKVLVIGGTVDGQVAADVDLFEPSTGATTVVGSLAEARTGHAAARLADGRVLVAGGSTGEGAVLRSAEVVDVATGSITSVASALQVPRAGASATTLIDGRVLVAGGYDGTKDLASAEIFDPIFEAFSLADTQLSVPRSHHTALLLPGNNGVLIAGGTSAGAAQNASDLFLPAIFPDPYSYGTGSFAPTGALLTARAGAISGPVSEGYAFAMGGGAPGVETYRFATIKTDKDDYAPGELAVITGTGWQPGEEVTLLFQEDPAVHIDYALKVVADGTGRIYWNQWAPEPHDLNVRFYLTATDSKSHAQITFTDSNPQYVTVSPASVTVAAGSTQVFTVSLTVGGNAGSCNVTLNASGPLGHSLPSGVSATFGTNPLTTTGASSNGISTSLTIATSNSTPTGAFTVTVSGTNSGDGCQGKGPTDGTTTLNVKSVGSVIVGSQTGTLTNGTAGSATYNVTVTRGGGTGNGFAADLSVTTAWPAGVTASFNPSTLNFLASDTSKTSTLTISTGASTPVGATAFTVKADNTAATGDFATGSGLLTVDPACTATSITGQPVNQSVTYGQNATFTAAANGDPSPTVQWQISTDNGGSWTNVSAETATTLTLIRPQVSQSGSQYRAVFTNSCSGTRIATSNAATLTVSAASVSPSISVSDKVYDGTTAATIASRSLTGIIGTDAVTLTGGTATFDNKNVGVGKTVTASGLSLTGTAAGNYVLSSTSATTTASITARRVTGSFTAANKTYDATVAAAITGRSLANVIAGDDVELTGGTATFDTKNVGTGKTVTATGFTLGGADSGNYSLASPTLTTTADITTRALTVTATGQNKVYDGSTTATVSLVTDKVSGDDVTAAYTSASFADKNVGTGEPVTVSGITISGTDAGNYQLQNTTANTAADITQKHITGSFSSEDKEYDGTIVATVLTRTLDGIVTGDSVSLIGGTAVFEDKNVGIGKPATLTGASLSGSDAGNYCLDSVGKATANITQRALTVSAAGINKVYDGTTAATVTLSTDKLGGDVVDPAYTTANFADKSVGTNKSVAVAGISISGGDAGNYRLTNTTASAVAAITPRTLLVSAAGVNKTYDGTTSATVTLSDDRVAGDSLTVAYAGATFGDKNVGTGKPVTVTGISVSGADAGNYTFNSSTTTSADITPRPITVTADGKSKPFGASDPPLTYQVTSGTLVAGDAFAGSLARDPGEAVASYAILQGTLTAGSNYALTYVGANLVITAWNVVGFYQPIGVTVPGIPPGNPTVVWNAIKGGQTVPLKFNLYMTSGGTELTDVTAVQGFTLARLGCTAGVDETVTADAFATTGNTVLRYDGLGGFFIQNWQSPKVGGQCYRVTMTAADGSSLSAFFKTK